MQRYMVMERDQKTPRNVRPLRPVATDAASIAHQRRLEELRRQVADGTYDPDAELIAREIVRRGLDSD